MYYAVVAALMFILPLSSIALEACRLPHMTLPILAIKWFGFWAVGVRLVLAGLRQIIQPAYTANVILGVKTEESLVLVRELGFANLAIGCVALTSLVLPSWRMPAAAAGCVFYLLAGINHALQSHRNRLEHVAMGSDLFVGIVLGAASFQILVM